MYYHCDRYNHLLKRKCSCGGDAEMIIDFVTDFEARCSRCHLSTHAYIKPEAAAQHWNAGDDIMETPLHIFWDDPEGWLRGEVTAIHIADDGFEPITRQSVHFETAIIEYTDKLLWVEHLSDWDGNRDSIDITEAVSGNAYADHHKIRPAQGETIRFDSFVIPEENRLTRLAYRWNDSWLLITAEQDHLVLTRASVPCEEASSSDEGAPPLNWT